MRVSDRQLACRYLLATLVLIALWFALLEQRTLWEPDEGRYAEISREMVASGDWITPRLNDLLYFEKPPLQYWATAAAYQLFGQHNWTARLWSTLTGLACVLLVFYAGRRLHSPKAGLYSALILASSLLYFALAHLNTLDTGFTLFLDVAVFALAFDLKERRNGASKRLWIDVACVAAGLALLSKGLAGVVLPAGALALYSIRYRDYTVWRKLAAPRGLTLFILVSAPWFIAVDRANPDFASFFFIHEHVTRYLTTEHHRAQPWWFYLPVLAAGALPWTVPMLRGWWRVVTAPRDESLSSFVFLSIFALAVFLFFSASGSKLPSYIEPLLPALAVLAAKHLCEAAPVSIFREIFWPSLALALVLVAAPYTAAVQTGSTGLVAEDVRLCFWLAAALWAAGATLSAWAFKSAKTELAVIAIALPLMAAYQVLFVAAEKMAPAKSSAALAQQIKPQLGVATRIYAVQLYPQSLPFYLGRPVTLVNFRGELDFGLAHEPLKGIPAMHTFLDVWRADRDAVAVMTKSTYQHLMRSGVPMQLIAEDTERIAVRRP